MYFQRYDAMCDTCGCNLTPGNRHLIEPGGELEHIDGRQSIEVLEHLLSANDHEARHNREHLDHHHVLAINLMSSPGSGKTSLLERTLTRLDGELRCAVVEGDLETENDARRIRSLGVPAVQITTGTACHLDAHMVHRALHELDLDNVDVLFIENVGNLVCPASFDLGQHRNLILLSVTEGDDKPAKYPVMFRTADAVIVSKADLLPYLDDFDPERARQAVRALANQAPIMSLSAKSGEGIEDWLAWLRAEVDAQRRSTASTPRPSHHEHHHISPA